MARIPIVQPGESQDESLEQAFTGMKEMGLEKFLNQLGVLANHPPLAKAIFQLLRTYYDDSVVPRKYLEMGILLVSVRNRCDYCVVHHAPPALDAGLSREQLRAIEEDAWEESGLFAKDELAVLRYVDRINANGGRMNDSTYDALREFLSEKQLVELTVRSAMCEFFNRFNEVFQIDMEEIARMLYSSAMEEAPRESAREPVESPV